MKYDSERNTENLTCNYPCYINSRRLEIELKSLKSELKKTKENKAKIKQEASDVKTKLKSKITELKCRIEDKSQEHGRLLNKDVDQLTESKVTRLKRKILNVKENIRRKVWCLFSYVFSSIN